MKLLATCIYVAQHQYFIGQVDNLKICAGLIKPERGCNTPPSVRNIFNQISYHIVSVCLPIAKK